MQMLGWALLGAGAAALAGFWAYYVIGAVLAAAPLIVRLGMVAVVVGAAFLLASAIRDRIRERKTEHFEEGDR